MKQNRPKVDFCSECDCGVKKFIVNRTRWLCQDKNSLRLHGLSDKEVKTQKYKPINPISAKEAETRHKYLEVCREIDQEIQWCESCGSPDLLTHSHLVRRSERDDLKAVKLNIMIQCMICHDKYESLDKTKLESLSNLDEIMSRLEQLDNKTYQEYLIALE